MLLPLSLVSFMFISHSWKEVLKELATIKAQYLDKFKDSGVRNVHVTFLAKRANIVYPPTYADVLPPTTFPRQTKCIEIRSYMEGDNCSHEVIGLPIFIYPSDLPQNIKEKIDVLFGESTDTTEVDITDEVNLELGRLKKAQRKNKGR